MAKQSARDKARSKKLTQTINRISRQNNISKAEATRQLGSTVGLKGVVTRKELLSQGARLTRVMNDAPTMHMGELVTNTERKNRIQALNKELRKIKQHDRGLYNEAKKSWVNNPDSKMTYETTMDLLKTSNEPTVDSTYPKTMEEAKRDERWGIYNVKFDKYLVYQLLNGNYEALLMNNPYDSYNSADCAYVYNEVA